MDQHEKDIERRRINRTELRSRMAEKLRTPPDSMHDIWLKWIDTHLRIIPQECRVKNYVVGIWLITIYEEICEHCERIGMSEDLLLESLPTYKTFQISWQAFCDEEDPDILQRKQRDVSCRTKEYSKRKVCGSKFPFFEIRLTPPIDAGEKSH